MKKKIGFRIAELRKGAGISQAQLASHLHVCGSTVGMYEQGRRVPGIEILIAISDYFDVSLDYLITGTDRSFGVTQDEPVEVEMVWCLKVIKKHH